MLESCAVMYKSVWIGTITYTKALTGRSFSYAIANSSEAMSLLPWQRYPFGLFSGMARLSPKNIVLSGVEPKSKEIEEWLAKRIIPSEREGIESILTQMNIAVFDVWKLSKHTRSMSFEDYYWLRFSDDERYEDIHIRYLFETGQLDKLNRLEIEGKLPF